jgi:hypothetical protein
MLCSSSVMEISGGGSVSLSCSSSLESCTKGGGGSCASSMYGVSLGMSGSEVDGLSEAAGGAMSRRLCVRLLIECGRAARRRCESAM